MQQPVNIHRGNLSETYAQLILSSFAIATPVPRQNDFQGIDFHCALLREVDGNFQPHSPFNLQVKSASDNTITYGGKTKSGRWRSHDIELLRKFQTPFFIGSVDKKDQTLHIHQTINRAFLWRVEKPPFEVKLILNSPGTDELTDGEKRPIEGLDDTDDYEAISWEIPVGRPILSLKLSEIEDREITRHAASVLQPYIEVDQSNIALLNAGLAHFRWPMFIDRNIPLNSVTIMRVAPDPPEALLQALTPAIACLLSLYETKGEKALILPWKHIVKQLDCPDGEFLRAVGLMRRYIDKAIQFAESTDPKEKDESSPTEAE